SYIKISCYYTFSVFTTFPIVETLAIAESRFFHWTICTYLLFNARHGRTSFRASIKLSFPHVTQSLFFQELQFLMPDMFLYTIYLLVYFHFHMYTMLVYN